MKGEAIIDSHVKSKIIKVINKIDSIPIDKKSIPQGKLDLDVKQRSNLFYYRGQFSPELIETILDNYAKPNSTVLDPFAGCGTTLFESIKKSKHCIGTEINPTGYAMSSTCLFANIKKKERYDYYKKSKQIIETNLGLLNNFDINENRKNKRTYDNRTEFYKSLISTSRIDIYLYNIIINSIIRYKNSNNKNGIFSNNFMKSFNYHVKLVKSLPYFENACKVYQCDARIVPIRSKTVDLIITSPPYINVFNYHQNNRDIMELDKWDILKVAKSEIGSNRKNRGNRFLTVIQYSIDMCKALIEQKRLLKKDGKIIMIIGRESKIRGISFPNYKIISSIAIGCAGLKLENRQERKFKNRFGQLIFEDILYFSTNGYDIVNNPINFARNISIYFLEKALDDINKNITLSEYNET